MKDRRPFLLARMQLPDESGCMPWTGRKNQHGYGELRDAGGVYVTVAHRAAYELFVGPIPAGHQLDHLCRNRACCNPMHLEPVTPAENTRRGFGATATNGRKTHCKRGHAFTEANTYVWGPSRICRQCRVDYSRERKRRVRAVAQGTGDPR